MTKCSPWIVIVGLLIAGCGDGSGPGGVAGHGGGAAGRGVGGATGGGGHGAGPGGSAGGAGATGGGGAAAVGGSGSGNGGAGGAPQTGSGGAGGSSIGGATGQGGAAGSMAGQGGTAGAAGTGTGATGTAGAGGGGGAAPAGELSVCSAFRARSGGRSGTLSFDLGHTTSINLMRVAGDRILSQETAGHWKLWDSTTRDVVLSGDAASALDLAGDTLAVTTSPTAAVVRSATDAHLLASLTLPGAALHVGPGGAYVWSAGTTALRAWTPAGALVVDVAGDYSQAKVVAVSGELRVALGPAGAGVIERVVVGTSARTTTPFVASFAAWFDDGAHFIAHTGDTVFIDALDGTQVQVVAFPAGAWMTAGGWGNYFWTARGTGSIYSIGNSTPLVSSSFPTISDSTADVPGYLVGTSSAGIILVFTASSVSELLLAPLVGTPVLVAASPEGHWAVGTSDGLVYDGRSALPRLSLSCGNMLSISGAPTGDAAISVSTRQIVVAQFGAAGPTSTPYRLDVAEPANVGSVELTFDGTELATSSTFTQYGGGFTQLHLLSLPTGATLSSWAATQGTGYSRLRVAGGGGLVSFIQDLSGTRSAAIVRTLQPAAQVYRSSTDPGEVPLLAPGGQSFALVASNRSPVTTRIYKRDGTLVTAVAGTGIVWMDDNRLLTIEVLFSGPTTYQGHLFDAMGNSLGDVPLVPMGNVNVVGTDGVYSTLQNSIYALTSGNATWTGSFPATLGGQFTDVGARLGGVAGGYVLYLSGHEVIAERY